MSSHPSPLRASRFGRGQQLTNQTQPNNIFQPQHRKDGQPDPQRGRNIHAQPEEPLVGRIDDARVRVRALEDPVRVPSGGVDLVPPAQAYEAAAGDVLEVVEVDG